MNVFLVACEKMDLFKYPAQIKLTKVMDLSVWIIQKSKIQICFVFEFRESTKVKKRQQKSSQPSKTLFFFVCWGRKRWPSLRIHPVAKCEHSKFEVRNKHQFSPITVCPLFQILNIETFHWSRNATAASFRTVFLTLVCCGCVSPQNNKFSWVGRLKNFNFEFSNFG